MLVQWSSDVSDTENSMVSSPFIIVYHVAYSGSKNWNFCPRLDLNRGLWFVLQATILALYRYIFFMSHYHKNVSHTLEQHVHTQQQWTMNKGFVRQQNESCLPRYTFNGHGPYLLLVKMLLCLINKQRHLDVHVHECHPRCGNKTK